MVGFIPPAPPPKQRGEAAVSTGMTDFATFLVERGAATHGEVLAAIDQQQRSRLPVGRIALDRGVLDAAQLFSVLALQAREPRLRFGEAAVQLGVLTQREFDEVLLEQRKRTPSLESFLVKAEVLDADQASALREEFERQAPPASLTIPRPLRRAG
jgi:hypothetical protein